MTYKRNSFVAVKSEEGGFYLCQVLENIPEKTKRNKKYKVKWLEEVGKNTYKISYDDFIEQQCIIDVAILINRKSHLILSKSELLRLEGLVKSSNTINVEQFWSEDELNDKERTDLKQHETLEVEADPDETLSLSITKNFENEDELNGREQADLKQHETLEVEADPDETLSLSITKNLENEDELNGREQADLKQHETLEVEADPDETLSLSITKNLENEDELNGREQADLKQHETLDVEADLDETLSLSNTKNLEIEDELNGREQADLKQHETLEVEADPDETLSLSITKNLENEDELNGREQADLKQHETLDVEADLDETLSLSNTKNLEIEDELNGREQADLKQHETLEVEADPDETLSLSITKNLENEDELNGREQADLKQHETLDVEANLDETLSLSNTKNLENEDELNDREQADLKQHETLEVEADPDETLSLSITKNVQNEDKVNDREQTDLKPCETQEVEAQMSSTKNLENDDEVNDGEQADLKPCETQEVEAQTSTTKNLENDDEVNDGEQTDLKRRKTLKVATQSSDEMMSISNDSEYQPDLEEESSPSCISELSSSGEDSLPDKEMNKTIQKRKYKVPKQRGCEIPTKRGSKIAVPASKASVSTRKKKLENENEVNDGEQTNLKRRKTLEVDTQSSDEMMSISNDSEYQPDLEEESSPSCISELSSSGEDSLPDKEINKTIQKRKYKVTKQRVCEIPTKRGTDIKVPISKASVSTGKKKVYDQIHCCFFCDKLICKMSRHLEHCHENEMEVAKILALPKSSLLRRNAFSELTRLGDYHYNCDILSKRTGELILIRRPSAIEKEGKTYSDYLPCPHCLGFLLKKHLWSHVKFTCHAAKKDDDHANIDKKKGFLSLSKALVGHFLTPESSQSFYDNIISTFKKKDGIKEICSEDPLIIRLGMLMFEKFNNTKNDLIRQNMRRLGRLVSEFRKIDSKFAGAMVIDCLQPNNFDSLIQAVKNLAIVELNHSDRPTMKIPSLALKLGHALRKCAALQRGTFLKEGNLKGERTMKSFLSIMDIEWENRISSTALITFKRTKQRKEDLLPLTSDLMKINSYLDGKIDVYIGLLKDCPSNASLWQNLAKATLARIMMFNKKRSGEVSKMKIKDFTERRNYHGENSEEIIKSFSDLEKKLMNVMTLIYIVGKRENDVPVLLTSEMKKAIDVLLLYRKNISVIKSSNEYMFPNLNSDRHQRGHDVIRAFCQELDLQKPHLITSTKLRKYIATVTQVVNLTENESDWLARHLGHNIRVHREYYRMQESAVELTKVSRLLLAVDEGRISEFSGQKLDEINLEDLPNLPSEAESEEDIDQPLTGPNENFPNLSSEGESEDIDKASTVQKKRSKRKSLENRHKPNLKTSTKTNPSNNKATRNVWPDNERCLLLQHFKQVIKRGNVPGKLECQEFIDANKSNPFFHSIQWKDVKYRVYNQIQKVKPKRV
ncbi:titin homolog [Macrosteles quadrilineatus]|uniref:titin homolog n=1 Tax=Macrosteles quadrilineatus TaxID=74068 RepID=UPI0023E25583|nr:titin homolog [Macrosteles quadrilineatus]